MPLPDRIQHLLGTIGQVAAEVPCDVEECREYVSVSKASTFAILNFKNRFPYFANYNWVYHVYRFRVRAELIESKSHISPDDLRDYQKMYFADEELVAQVLSMWLGDLSVLGKPVDCAIPL